MTSKENDSPDIDSDDDFLESIDNLDQLDQTPPDMNNDEDFDFDGHDVPLQSIRSWIDEGERTGDESDEFSTALSDESDNVNNNQTPPDAADLFGATSPDVLSEIAALEEQRDAYLEALRQLQADFENYKKRVVRDQQDDAEAKSNKLIEDLLPVLDNFELALKNIDHDDPQAANIAKGVELVFTELLQVMKRQGLEVIHAQGELFDPEIHDAVTHEDNDEHEHEIVVEVLRTGYMVRGRVIRPAMVRVAK